MRAASHSCQPQPQCDSAPHVLMCRPLVTRTPPCPLPQVYHPGGWTLRALVAVNAFMLLVCLGAVVGSVQSLVDQWSTFQFFS